MSEWEEIGRRLMEERRKERKGLEIAWHGLIKLYLNYISSQKCFVCDKPGSAYKVGESEYTSIPLCQEHGKEMLKVGHEVFADLYIGDMNDYTMYKIALDYLIKFLNSLELNDGLFEEYKNA